jgi:dipeptidyl aminopeptidase/acylaminoacyl peptidase
MEKEKMHIRQKINLILVGVLTLGFLSGCSHLQRETELIPMEAFFKNPDETGFQLSPDGNALALMKPWKNRMNVFIQKIGEPGEKRVTRSTARDVAGFFWANNNRIAFVQDRGGNENFHLFAVDTDGNNLKELTPFEGVRVNIVDDLEEIEDEMLIGMNRRDPRVFDVYRINIDTGKMEMIAENPGNIQGWLTDNDGKLRMAMTTDGVNHSLLYRETEKEPFKPIVTTNFKERLAPLFFTYDNRFVYMASNLGRDKTAIYKYDIVNNKALELIYEHPDVDVTQLLRSRKRRKITGAAYVTDKRHYHFFDEQRRALQADLEKRLPGYEVVISSSSRDETKILVRTYSDKSLGAYYFYDLNSREFMKIADVSPWLNEEELCDQQPISYESRDGLTIHGYLTLPKGGTKNLPVVVNPHGGPWARDHWGFNSEAQFLANRGYAVLQMNFRGSTGYGKAFWQAGFKKWGKEMQDDISDGVAWLIDQGIADPGRIGIYGGSYGGYATLAGLAFTPDLYACGVDYVGVSNIFTLLSTLPPYWEPGRQKFYEMVGDPVKDSALLKEVSPVFHADQIKAPLFVAQGANDPRVKKAEADQIVNALKQRGIDVPYMVKENEGHGFHNEENRFDFYRAMEGFLGKHLGGRVERVED